MRRTRHLAALAAALIAVGLAVVPALATARTHHVARTHVAVGIGDQHAAMFSDPNFLRLKLRKVRYFIPWDAIRHPAEMAAANAYVSDARRHHISVLMHISTNDLRAKRARLPSVRSYKRDVGRLVRHFRRMGVRDWGVWNEENHKSQPTYRSPSRAASYFKTMYGLCRHCTIVALDVLDQRGVGRYIQRFYRALSPRWRGRARLVGIHNYSDTNRPYRHGRGTRTIINTVRHYNRRATFWLTETGGVVNFGRSFPCNTRRAARMVNYMFRLARQYRRYVKRLYAYNWTGANCRGFDAGLTDLQGHLRPGYAVFRRDLRGFTR